MLFKSFAKTSSIFSKFQNKTITYKAQNHFAGPLSEELTKLYGKLVPEESQGRIMDIQNGVIFFSNPKNFPIGYKSIVTTPDDKQAIVLAISEKISSAIVLSDTKAQVGDAMKFSNNPKIGLETVADFTNFGKIVNYSGKVIQGEQKNPDGPRLEIYKKTPSKSGRKSRTTQLFTGNIAVDFTQPLFRGNFICFDGESGTGKTSLAVQTLVQFLRGDELVKTKKSKKAVYINVNVNEANTVLKQLTDYGAQDDVVIFSATSRKDAEKYFAPFAGLAYANLLRQQGNEVVVVFDDIVEHYIKEIQLFNTLNQPFAPLNLLQEFYNSTGCFEDSSSLTAVLIYDNNQANPEHQTSIQNYYFQLESLADVRIKFDLRDPLYRNAMPKVDCKPNKIYHFNQPTWIAHLSKRLNDLLLKLREQKEALSLMKELKIQVDPWEYYLFLDSTYFMKLLISSVNKRKMGILEEIVTVGFVLRAIEEDTISYFKDDPSVVLSDLFKFIPVIEDFEKTDLLTYINRLAQRENPEKEYENIVMAINRIHELFFTHCKIQGKLLPYKKDYFN